MTRPRRSVFGVPGSDAEGLSRARDLSPDGFLLDLEGTVAPDAKSDARDRVCALVARNVDRSVFGDREVVIRINPAGTAWHDDDLAAAIAAAPDAVVVPKVSSAADIAAVEAVLARERAAAHVGIWAMLELPRGVLDAAAIAVASPRLTGLSVGTNDLAAELRTGPTPDRMPLVPALAWCVLAARAAGVRILDGPYNADDDGFAAEARQGRALGFDGKTLVHPSQIEPANDIFAHTR